MRFIFCLLAALLISAPAHAAGELRIGAGPNPFGAPALIAKEKHWIEDELAAAGFAATKVSYALFTSGPPMNEAFGAGQLDVVLYGDTPALLARAGGIDIKVIGIASAGWKNNAAIVAKDSPIQTVKDLKGKRVATFKGTTAHHLLYLALDEAGLKFEDIQFFNIPITDMGTALLKGDIDAAFLWEPALSGLEAGGGVRIIRDGTGLKNSLSVIGVSERYLAAHPGEVRALLKALKRGADFLETERGAAAALLAPLLRLSEPVAVQSLSHFHYDIVVHPEERAALRSVETYLRANNLLRSPVDTDALIDTSFADALGYK